MKSKPPRRNRIAALLATILSVAALFNGRANAQNLLQDGGFELGLTAGPGTLHYATTYGAWSSSSIYATTILLGMPFPPRPAYEGNEAMQLAPGTSFYGELHQSFATTPGTSYRVSLAVCVETAQAIVIGGTTTNLVANFVPPGGNVWGTNSYTFVATGLLTTLSIRGNTNAGAASTFIDDVRVTALPIIQDGGFELGLTTGPGTYFSSTTYGAWSAGGGLGTFMFGMPFGVTPAYEGQEAVLIGNGGAAGFVTQSFETSVGVEYWVSYAVNVADGGNGSVRATVFTPSQTNLDELFVAPGGSKWGVASHPFIATGTTTTVKIQNVSGASIIDDVRIGSLPLNMALELDGVDDRATLGSGVNLANQSFTLEVWAKRADANLGFQFLFSQGVSANNQLLHVGFHNNRATFRFYNNDYDASATFTDTAWHHWAFTYDVGNNSRKIYRDGVIVGENVASADFIGSGTMFLGRYTTSQNYFHGQMDEVRIWNVARSEAQIRANLNSRLTGSEVGLVAYHRMDEGTGAGSSLLDATANGNNGTLVSGPQRVLSTVPTCGLATVTEVITSPVSTLLNYEGYQGGGVHYRNENVGISDVTLNVTNLCSDIAPGAGLAGVDLQNIFAAEYLTLNYSGGLFTNRTTNAAGLLVKTTGQNGNAGTGNGGDGGNAFVTRDVAVNSSGSITTSGTDAEGILAVSEASRGGHGAEGTLATGGNGGRGGNGGASDIDSTSTITTSGGSSPGILAIASGGAGGNGGGGGSFFNGGTGGRGGAGGFVTITGSGMISTTGSNSIGVYALSQGGRGGNGGEDASWTETGSGGSGGSGGRGSFATVEGSWNVTTLGDAASGISARSLGGAGGTAQGGGWLAGDGGDGGASGNGFRVIVDFGVAGTIDTSGDEAHGILAQSIGGFAGSGGAGDSIFSASGGDGGSAGHGSVVNVTNRGSIITRGEGANAILAESVGGGGGSGGSDSGLFDGGGGDSSAGGHGGKVTVDNQGQLTTSNSYARGIFAQSVGGSGGNGASDSGLFYSVGSSGGNGGDGDNVTVTNSGQIATEGSDSSAIFAQSVGGGGGTGGGAVSAGAFGNGAIGGSGGPGGDGAQVNVFSSASGSITNLGNRSHGIFAQSVGGGGGNGGFALSGAGGAFAGAVGIGGSGGVAGNASNVLVNSQSAISTGGENAHGIFAQSVGGGGGSGGYSITVSGGGSGAAALSMGGTGGSGGDGNSVDLTSGGTIQTTGDRSYGILAQSVGGGGGDGGFSIAGTVAGGVAAPFSFGGDGGVGGVGGDVVVNSQSQISTIGRDAHGIFVQSVGGGGGSGGFSVSGGISGGAQAGASFGGKGGSGSSAGNVTVTTDNAINTVGNHSYGILAQSIGGGGGDGGFSVAGGISGSAGVNFAMGGTGGAGGVSGNVDVDTLGGSITTAGTNSHAIFAQSVGGGGGSGGFSVAGGISGGLAVSVGIGGGGGSGAAGSDVDVTTSNTSIKTSGEHSYGILAQSVGGGGGEGGFSVAGGISGGPSVNFAMGGAGGAGGVGGNVTVDSTGSIIITSNRNSHAIFAQSVGGGGGSGGFTVAAGISTSAAVSAGIGGNGGSGADAGMVALTSSGSSILTHSNSSYGILAQSVGGGGGDGGFSVAGGISSAPSVSFAMGGGGGVAGDGAAVGVTNLSGVTTHGQDSHGIFAQSVGGGGGSGGFSVAGGISTSGAAISASIGGKGTNGGVGGNVILTNSGAITTSGNRAYGILAQSVGGGGGDGGFSVAGAISQGPAITFSMGGGAGPGGEGSAVDVGNSGDIFTGGELAYGIFAQSVGGGGGSGGFSVAGSLSANSGGLAFGLGGAAGSGADAGAVSVINHGNVETTNSGSHAIMAQSVGGGGGAGGFGGALAGGFGDGAKLAVGIGGTGGEGGDAGDVVVESTGPNITTRNAAAYGVFAQSVGGGGGDGGAGLAASFGTQPKAVNLALAIGRSAGSGGIGGAVAVNNASAIDTEGIVSHGILAQSIGGGGGNGGFSASGTLSTSTNAIQGSLSLGGGGGSGGSAGNVGVTNSGNITTLGLVTGVVPDLDTNLAVKVPKVPVGSVGILAQSIGGGGGNGGSAFSGSFSGSGAKNFAITLGGAGGSGNSGGDVSVDNSGVIETWGTNSHGVLAQSIGGGGGNGGSAISVGLYSSSATKTYNVNTSVSVGGGGGDGGIGGGVQVNNSSNIITRGANSSGIYAQSVGGGGGEGGSSLALAGGWDNNSMNAVNLTLAIGGGGGEGNDGSQVDVLNDGSIETSGNTSHGIFAQSVGGGGGVGGNARSLTVTLDPKDWVAQSGFFDSMLKSWSVSFGGDGGGASDGGIVTVTNVGDILTRGEGAFGILAQSVGGGGGFGGAAEHGIDLEWVGIDDPSDQERVDVLLEATPLRSFNAIQAVFGGTGGSSGNGGDAIVSNTGTIETLGHGAHGIFAQSLGGGGGAGGLGAIGLVGKIGMGGEGGTSGDGADVIVAQFGDITTSGRVANGITAQSVGGGGGMAGSVERGIGSFGVGLAFGNGGGNAGDGGAVSVASGGNITTSNSASYGIFAQSVGGGGGVAGGIGNGLGFAGSTGGSGNGGAVAVTHSGDITTYGLAADGMFAQSAGGSNSVGGTVDITVTGSVTAHGTNANGIFAQSIGLNGAGDITINILGGGTVHGGSADSAGVRIEGGANNTLTNHGTITTLNGASGVAIRGGSGNEHVENFGTLVGQVLLGGGVNSWINRPGSVFTVETAFELGAGNTFDNSGLLTGNGQIVGNVVSAGAIAPGDSAGSLSIDGTLTLLADASVTFEIGGTQAGVTHDFISVMESASLLGTLDLWLTDAFEPASTNAFTLMDFGSSSGGFSNVSSGRVLARDNLGSFSLSYDTTSLVVDDYRWDTDGDGMADRDEILAGTDWLDPGSVLAITSLTRDVSGSMVLRFPWVTGNYYALEYTHDPGSEVWEDVVLPQFTFPETNTCQWIDDGTLTGGMDGPGTFYRVRLLSTPLTGSDTRVTIARELSGNVVLQFTGVPGNAYAVEYTSDLVGGTWTDVPSPVISFPTPAMGQWIDDGSQTGGLGGSSRFYRIKPL